jgi:hypothetical protein
MDHVKVRAFFYGSFIREDVQEKGGLYDANAEVARLNGFDIHISPHAALSSSAEHCVYGVLVDITHKQLDAMYLRPVRVCFFRKRCWWKQPMEDSFRPSATFRRLAKTNRRTVNIYEN